MVAAMPPPLSVNFDHADIGRVVLGLQRIIAEADKQVQVVHYHYFRADKEKTKESCEGGSRSDSRVQNKHETPVEKATEPQAYVAVDESVSSLANQLERVSTNQESATPPAGPVNFDHADIGRVVLDLQLNIKEAYKQVQVLQYHYYGAEKEKTKESCEVPSDDLDEEECTGNQMPNLAITGTRAPKDVSEDSMENEEHPVRSDIADEKSLECNNDIRQFEDEGLENARYMPTNQTEKEDTLESSDLVKQIVISSAFITEQAKTNIAGLDELLSMLEITKVNSDIQVKLLSTICEAYLFAGQFQKVAEIITTKEITPAEMMPTDCQTQMACLRLVCCAAEANAGLHDHDKVVAYYITAESITRGLPKELDKDVIKKYNEVRCRLDEIEKLINKYRYKSRNSITQRIGAAGGVLELPDCSIYFPSKSLPQSILLHATTTEVSDDAPKSMVPVTPILRLNPNTDLCNPATAKLVTWHSSKNAVLTHIYHKKSENSAWQAVQSPPVSHTGNNRIEFEINEFCSFCGFVDDETTRRTEFIIMSRLFYDKQRKLLANRLFPFCETYKDVVQRDMAERKFSDLVCSTDISLTIKENDEIEVCVVDIEQPTANSQIADLKSVKVKIVIEFLRRYQHRPQNFRLPNLDGLVDFRHIIKQFRDGEFLDTGDDHPDRIDLGHSIDTNQSSQPTVAIQNEVSINDQSLKGVAANTVATGNARVDTTRIGTNETAAVGDSALEKIN